MRSPPRRETEGQIPMTSAGAPPYDAFVARHRLPLPGAIGALRTSRDIGGPGEREPDLHAASPLLRAATAKIFVCAVSTQV